MLRKGGRCQTQGLHCCREQVSESCGSRSSRSAVIPWTLLRNWRRHFTGLGPSCTMLSEQGCALAQTVLGDRYETGLNVARDPTQAAEWFRKAAEQGFPAAQVKLGLCFHRGTGIVQVFAEALLWFHKGAAQGDASAPYNIGVCYQNGDGVAINMSAAGRWYRMAADQGYGKAQYSLALLHEIGAGVPKDLTLALSLYKKRPTRILNLRMTQVKPQVVYKGSLPDWNERCDAGMDGEDVVTYADRKKDTVF